MKKLFSTANVFTYGGNVKEEGFLKMLSDLIGQYRYTSVSTSRQKDSRSTSRQDSTDDTLSVADLGAMTKGRAIMLGSGSRAVLLRTVPVSDRPYADKVRGVGSRPQWHTGRLCIRCSNTSGGGERCRSSCRPYCRGRR